MILGFLLFVFPVVAMLSLFFYLPIWFYFRRKKGKQPFIRHLTIYAYIGTVFSVLFITIFMFGIPGEFPVQYHFLNLVPFVWVKETYAMGFAKMIEQLFMNVVMLIPVGIFYPAVFSGMRRWWKTMLSAMLFIFCIETIQYFIGRSADIDDLIMNTLGAMIGYGIFTLLNRGLSRAGWWKKAIGQ